MRLRIALDNLASRPTADVIVEFGRQVHVLSVGAERIDPVWQAPAPQSRAGGDRLKDGKVSGFGVA